MSMLLASKLAHRLMGEKGGVAVIMLMGFIALAVPLAQDALTTATLFSRNSQIYDRRLTGAYTAGAGVEVALHEILTNPGFDDDLTQESPTRDVTADVNGGTVPVTVTKIYGEDTLQGQGVVLSKSVTPTSALVNATTTFTYDIIVKNEGSGTAQIKQVRDYLPPGFAYVSGSTSGLTTSAPTITSVAPATCGVVPDDLFWNIFPGVDLGAGQEVTLTFQGTATLSDGTYYNQASVRYDPWWVAPDVDIYSPYMAEVTVGTGNAQKCGNDLHVLVTQSVVPEAPPPGVPTELIYTITVENVTSSDLVYVCKIEDLLPPTFTYDTNSAGDYSSNIRTLEPEEEWQSAAERWNLRWADGLDAALEPLDTIDVGQSKTQQFRASVTPAAGVNYYSEVDVTWSTFLTGGKCNLSPGNGGTSHNGTGDATYVDPPILYDIQAIAPDGTVQSRIVFYDVNGELQVLSWQEY